MTTPDDLRLIGIAWQLDRLRWVERGTLVEIVQQDGACMSVVLEDEPPWADDDLTDPELAELLCRGCTVQDECLELELRLHGEETTGVWAGLPEEERRELYLHWLRRGERAEEIAAPWEAGDLR
jgi:WhiB family redox-sensing transcriptional regulator